MFAVHKKRNMRILIEEACAASGTINDVPDKIDVIKVKTTFANAFLNRCTYMVTYLCFHKYTYCHPHPPTRKTSRQRCQGIHSGILIFAIWYSIYLFTHIILLLILEQALY
jgi:hypothetical protein